MLQMRLHRVYIYSTPFMRVADENGIDDLEYIGALGVHRPADIPKHPVDRPVAFKCGAALKIFSGFCKNACQSRQTRTVWRCVWRCVDMRFM